MIPEQLLEETVRLKETIVFNRRYLHEHPKVKFDEDALVGGSVVYAYTAMRWLEEHK